MLAAIHSTPGKARSLFGLSPRLPCRYRTTGTPFNRRRLIGGVMPDRVIRDELLESDRWLSLPRNTHRLAFVCLIPAADPLGNMEGSDGRLWRLWHEPLHLQSRQAVPEILESLVGSDLVRLYDAGGKRFLHIPRYKQRLRYLGRIFPLSPWTTDEDKQRVAKISPGDSQASAGCAPAEVKRSDVDVEEKRKEEVVPSPKVGAVDNSQQVKTVLEGMNVKSEPRQRSRAEQLAYVKANSKAKP